MEDLKQQQDLQRFGELVLEDPELYCQLRATANEDEFVKLATQLGAKRGCSFTPATITSLIRERRREWLERWL